MELSINKLLGPLLSAEQLEASFDSMGLDDQLIKDGTYFMIFCDEVFVGCGGWSNRETLFGGNHTPNRDDNFLDPLKDSARIRAMYTHPDWVRQGIGSLVMHLGENAARKLGLIFLLHFHLNASLGILCLALPNLDECTLHVFLQNLLRDLKNYHLGWGYDCLQTVSLYYSSHHSQQRLRRKKS